MDLPASWHAEDALTGLVTGTLALGALALLAGLGRLGRAERTTAGVVAAAVAAVVALLPALGAERLTRVSGAGMVAAVAVAAAAGVGARRLHDERGRPVATSVLLATAAGIWAAVPDTEAAVVVLSSWAPLAGAGLRPEPAGESRMPPVVAWCALALVAAFAAVWGADAREQAMPGALACFGLALVVPALEATRRALPRPALLVVLHAAAVVAAARWATRVDSVGAGLARALAVLAALGLAVLVSGRRAVPGRPPRSRPEPRPR